MTYENGIGLLAKKLYTNDMLKAHNIVPEANELRHAQASAIAIFMGDLFARNPYDVMFEARVVQREIKAA